ncbi:MAG: glycogen debranching enzyme, partial [Candidatus Brocadiia bacterium]
MSGYLRKVVTLPGYPLPLGARHTGHGIQFSIFSRHADDVTLVLFESDDPDSAFREIPLDAEINRTGDIWHVLVENLPEGQLYGYRINGPYAPGEGHRFNPKMLLIDPYARSLAGVRHWDLSRALGYDAESPDLDASISKNDSAPFMPRCIAAPVTVVTAGRRPMIAERDHVIYELHVRGFTIHESSKVGQPGTFRGLIDKIPYLKELGVNAVELMPVQEFDEDENTNINPLTGERLKNFWGYSTIAFFAPKGSYSSSGRMGEQVEEFREMA